MAEISLVRIDSRLIHGQVITKGIKLEIYSVEKAVEQYKENMFGIGKLLILFKDIPTCYEALSKGLHLEYIQLGGIASAPGKKAVYRAISLDDKDVEYLKEMVQKGIEIAVHIIPEETKVEVQNILKKY